MTNDYIAKPPRTTKVKTALGEKELVILEPQDVLRLAKRRLQIEDAKGRLARATADVKDAEKTFEKEWHDTTLGLDISSADCYVQIDKKIYEVLCHGVGTREYFDVREIKILKDG